MVSIINTGRAGFRRVIHDPTVSLINTLNIIFINRYFPARRVDSAVNINNHSSRHRGRLDDIEIVY